MLFCEKQGIITIVKKGDTTMRFSWKKFYENLAIAIIAILSGIGFFAACVFVLEAKARGWL